MPPEENRDPHSVEHDADAGKTQAESERYSVDPEDYLEPETATALGELSPRQAWENIRDALLTLLNSETQREAEDRETAFSLLGDKTCDLQSSLGIEVRAWEPF
jgi:hypothetical protein